MSSISHRHAVLYKNTIMWIEGTGFHKIRLEGGATWQTLHELADTAYQYYITHLWMYPGSDEPVNAKSEKWNFSPYENRKKQTMGYNVRLKGHQRKDLEIIFPERTAWHGTEKAHGWTRDITCPQDLLIVLHYLELAMRIIIGSSPGRAGWNYLKKLHPEWIEEIPTDLKSCHFTREAATDIIWDRELSLDEMVKLYLHKFDKGGAYPYAGSQTDIGAGIPVHVDHGEDARHEKSHPQAVGIWRCSISYTGEYDASMPTVWREDKGSYKATQGWLVGPIIRLLRSQGHTVTVHEGWVFPERHDVLSLWANNMWEIRQGFDAPGRWKNTRCAQLAKRAVKQIVNSMIGMTAFSGFDDDDEMKRPDIRLQVIGRHRELTWHNINKIKQLYGVTPVIVYMDAIYLLSDEPDGRKAFPELVKREGKLGGWKYEGRIGMDKACPILIEKLSEGGKLEALNAIGWVQE